MGGFRRTYELARSNVKMFVMKRLSLRQVIKNQCPISVVSIETTQHCNRRCSYCPVSFDPKPVRAMDLKIFRRIIDQLTAIKFHGRLTYHFYNEPLLNSELEKLVEYASHHLSGVNHVIYTNGDLLTTERATSLFNAGVTEFVVTDHGGRELTEPVRYAARPLASFWSRIKFRRYTSDTALFNRGGLVKVENQRKLKYCAYLAYEMVIDVDGNVILCCNDYYASHQFGNVMQTPILDIWYSAAMSQLRSRLLQGHFDLPICQTCAGVVPASGLNPPRNISRTS